MHIFLQGPKRIGKSTVIRRTLDILMDEAPLELGGFFTWNGGKDDPHVYMRPASALSEGEIIRLASFNAINGGLKADVDAFEVDGVRILRDSKRADMNLIIMDELGFLEKDAPLFRQAALDVLDEDIPVLGVLRLGGVEWHEAIKRNPRVTLYDVDEKNRDNLPRVLAGVLKNGMRKL